ncbi:hypothetical protein FO519_005340 [Halicephalobus sp. NKZ332]|nr:hypothetical protein FO519_005340 [Halicephalobus sp. NKZ332]
MGKKPRPKSKEQKLNERRKNFLDEEEPEELFLDEGASAEESTSGDEAPEEVSTKKPRLDDDAEVEEPQKKKKRKRRIKKEEPGIYSVETEDLKVKVVAEKTVTSAQIMHPPIHFKDMLLQEVTRSGRRKAAAGSSKIPDKWLKANSKNCKTIHEKITTNKVMENKQNRVPDDSGISADEVPDDHPFFPLPTGPVAIKLVDVERKYCPRYLELTRKEFQSILPRLPDN